MMIREQYSKHWMRIEFTLAVCSAIAFWILWRYGMLPVSVDINLDTLYLTQAQLDAELLGFMMATLAIIFTQLGTPRLERVREHPAFNKIWKTYINTIKYLAVALITAILAIILEFSDWIIILNLMAISVSAARIGRCIWILENVIKISLQGKPTDRHSDQ